MRADQRKFHYIYKITRTDGSGKYYIGMHSTDDLEDGYFGSGERLWHSVKRHGKEKHSKDILEFLPTRKELAIRERELVNPETLKDVKCLNLALGGFDSPRNEGKIRSLESREKSRLAMGSKHSGPGNPNFGSKWITDGLTEQKFKGELPRGFRFGRLDMFGESRMCPPSFEVTSPRGEVFIGRFKDLCREHDLNKAKMREFMDGGKIPLAATRVQTRNCVGWEIKKVTIRT
jgi:hypothetical protein